MENKKNDIGEEMSKRKAEKGIENIEALYQQIQDGNEEDEQENDNEKK